MRGDLWACATAIVYSRRGWVLSLDQDAGQYDRSIQLEALSPSMAPAYPRNSAMRHLPLIPSLVLLFGCLPLGAAELLPGLVGEYYAFPDAVEDFPKLSPELKPTLRRADPAINWDSTDEAWPKTQLVDHFAVRWSGVLRVPKDATYTLYLESDDGSRLSIDGRQLIDNGGQHAMEEKSGEIPLTAGDHPIVLDYFQNEGGKGCKLSWSTAEVEKASVPASALLHSADVLPAPVAPDPLPAAADRKPGLRFEVFPVDGQDDNGRVPSLSADLKPALSRIDAQVDVAATDQNWPGTNLSSHYYIRWTGILRVPTDGMYTFTTESDDGSWLAIGGVDVVDNAGFHAMQEAKGVISLKAGDHPIRLDFRQAEGEAGCRLLWTIPGRSQEIIPASALFHADP
jgi:PA14 domain